MESLSPMIRRAISFGQPALRVALAIFVFISQTVLAFAVESNLWKERRRNLAAQQAQLGFASTGSAGLADRAASAASSGQPTGDAQSLLMALVPFGSVRVPKPWNK